MSTDLLTQIKNMTPVMKEESCSVRPILYDREKCIGCNSCVNICQCDILIPSPVKGEHPVVMYPGECYYCGACVMVCPRPGAIRLSHPLMNRARFVPVISPTVQVLSEPEDMAGKEDTSSAG